MSNDHLIGMCVAFITGVVTFKLGEFAGMKIGYNRAVEVMERKIEKTLADQERENDKEKKY